jgi:hypothetical protein
VIGGKPIAVLLQSISDVSAINPLVAFYDIHGRKGEVLFFYFVPDTTRDCTHGVLVFHIQKYKLLRRIKMPHPNKANGIHVTNGRTSS